MTPDPFDDGIRLHITSTDFGLIEITWEGDGVLKSSSHIEEPFIAVAEQTNPFVTMPDPPLFYVIERD